MKINLINDRYKKDVIDICRIFPIDKIEFAESADIRIDESEIELDKVYKFNSRHELKKILYDYFSDLFSYKSPWGIITGTKPQKLYDKYIKSYSEEKLIKDFYISKDKIGILRKIKKENQDIKFDKNNIHLYINIPFCPSRCSYCSFPTIIYGKNDRRQEYLEALIYEIKSLKNYINNKKLRSIYIGGGTPSSLTYEQMKKLFICLSDSFDLSSLEEFTFEAGREDTLDEDKLKLMKKFKVTRISLNPQTFNKDTLNKISRNQDTNNFIKIFNKSKKLGFIINMDLILGLEDEGIDDLSNTLNYIQRLKPFNLTIHTLSLKRGSKLNEKIDKKDFSKNNIENLVSYSQKRALEMGYKPYYLYRQKEILGNFENIGYSLKGKISIYNIVTNEEKESIIGLGMTSNSKIIIDKKVCKFTNYKNLDDYINNLDDEINIKINLLKGEKR